MNKQQIMNDPFGSMVMYGIEKRINQMDAELKQNGIVLNDSNVKSALAKAEKLAKSGSLASKPKDKKEEAILKMSEEINKLKFDLIITDENQGDFENRIDIVSSFWIDAIDAIKKSLNLRMVAGGRGYLNYLEGFMAKLQARK